MDGISGVEALCGGVGDAAVEAGVVMGGLKGFGDACVWYVGGSEGGWS